jgi:hypothetical protein
MSPPLNDALDYQRDPLGSALAALLDEGWELWERFDREVRSRHWHPFVAADSEIVLRALVPLRAPGRRFLEWGSATGVITIMAGLLGFEAYGIELDEELVAVARSLAARHGSRARFVAGSFVPAGYRPSFRNGDGRLGTIGDGVSPYAELGLAMDEFDVVHGYPWTGEEAVMLDLHRQYGSRDGHLLLTGDDGVTVYRGGRIVSRTTK